MRVELFRKHAALRTHAELSRFERWVKDTVVSVVHYTT